jgi:FkbM family methyltransferase
MSLKGQFFTHLKRHAASQLFLDVWPGYAPLLDGTRHRLPGKVRELLELWETNPALRREAHAAYAAYQGGSFFDVGSFHGVYSWLLAPKATPGDMFVSCEPDPRIVNDLLRNLATFTRIFPKTPVSYISQPIGSGGGLTIQNTSGGHPQFGSDPAAEGGNRTLTLDALSATLRVQPAFVKIDVEGAEFAVLQGMEHLLSEVHPTIMLEIHPPWLPPGVTVEDVRAILSRHGYRNSESDVSNAIRELWQRAS